MSINRSISPVPTLQPLADEQVKTLFAVSTESLATQDLADVVKIILETGLRAGELRDLRWIDADIIGGHFSVKGNAPTRYVPFGPGTTKVLTERRECHSDSEYVFGESRQGFIQRVSRQLSGLAPRIGVHRLTLQTLRQTFFTRLVNAGVPAVVIMAIGGWRSYASIMIFMHHSDVEIARAYNSALGKANGGKQ